MRKQTKERERERYKKKKGMCWALNEEKEIYLFLFWDFFLLQSFLIFLFLISNFIVLIFFSVIVIFFINFFVGIIFINIQRSCQTEPVWQPFQPPRSTPPRWSECLFWARRTTCTSATARCPTWSCTRLARTIVFHFIFHVFFFKEKRKQLIYLLAMNENN